MPIKPFLLIVTDRDKQVFTVEGPMMDDRPWNDAVVAAQNAGRQVNCSTPGEGLTRAAVIQSWQKTYGQKLVEPGSIVSPISN